MPFISQPGTYQVTLENCHWEKHEDQQGNMKGYVAVLTGRDAEGETITARQYANANMRGSTGKTNQEYVCELLEKFGMANGDPNNIAMTNGQPAQFVCEMETGTDGKERLRVKWINPPGPAAADPSEVAAFFGGGVIPESQPAPSTTSAPDTAPSTDDLGF